MRAGARAHRGLIEFLENAVRKRRGARAAAGECEPDQHIVARGRILPAGGEGLGGVAGQRQIGRIATAQRRTARKPDRKRGGGRSPSQKLRNPDHKRDPGRPC
jgi:hypothetical protein